VSSHYTGVERALVPGTLRGFRQWRPGLDQSLRPVNIQEAPPWSRGINHAICSPKESLYTGAYARPHSAPHSPCQCGFYAHYDPEISVPLNYYVNSPHTVHGIIEASGKVIMGTRGFRAEKAEIVALYGTFQGSHEGVYDISQRYQVPYFPDPGDALRMFPPQDVKELGIEQQPEGVPTQIVSIAGWPVPLLKVYWASEEES
jgi:hypothetical protein